MADAMGAVLDELGAAEKVELQLTVRVSDGRRPVRLPEPWVAPVRGHRLERLGRLCGGDPGRIEVLALPDWGPAWDMARPAAAMLRGSGGERDGLVAVAACRRDTASRLLALGCRPLGAGGPVSQPTVPGPREAARAFVSPDVAPGWRSGALRAVWKSMRRRELPGMGPVHLALGPVVAALPAHRLADLLFLGRADGLPAVSAFRPRPAAMSEGPVAMLAQATVRFPALEAMCLEAMAEVRCAAAVWLTALGAPAGDPFAGEGPPLSLEPCTGDGACLTALQGAARRLGVEGPVRAAAAALEAGVPPEEVLASL